MSVISIIYDDENYDTYQGVQFYSDTEVKTFYSDCIIKDWFNAMHHTVKYGEACIMSSSVDHFISDSNGQLTKAYLKHDLTQQDTFFLDQYHEFALLYFLIPNDGQNWTWEKLKNYCN